MRLKVIIIVLSISFVILSQAMAATAKSSAEDEGQKINNIYYRVIYNRSLRIAPSLGPDWADWTARSIIAYSYKWGVPPLLAAANFEQESGFNMAARSRTGAIGIAQLQPETASYLGVNPYDPNENVEGGIRYLAEQLYTFQNTGEWCASLAIAAYNSGPESIRKYGGIPPYEETINHVISVGAIYNRLDSEFQRLYYN